MKFSAKARYGLRVVYILALNEKSGETLSNSKLAGLANVSEPYLEKIMSSLKKANIVQSQIGIFGGYKLSDEPKNITVGSVLKALEGDIFTSECVQNDCHNNKCPNKDIFGTIYTKVNEVLENMTLQDVIDNKKESI